MKKCEADNCIKKAHARGFCPTHLARFNRGADINAPIRPLSRRKSEVCSIENCENPYYCKDMCHLHYKRDVTGVDLAREYNGYQRGKFKKSCLNCLKVFYVQYSLQSIRYCSSKCWGKTRIGNKNSHWKGGITGADSEERNRFAREVRELVFARDNYTCQICQTENSGRLQVDHIKQWSKFPYLRFELDNCRTVCVACHYYIHFKRKMPVGIVWGRLKHD